MTTTSAMGRPAALAMGEVLEGKYQIIREVGRGAMGVVYEALHIALERRVAVKTLLEEVSADPQVGARFEREARAASAIGHPNIVDVFDLGRTGDGLLFMVMELLDGESLASLLKRTPKVPIALALHVMTQVLGGLSAAHKHGIVHRDLKPDNIFIVQSEERPNLVKIVDFGISKVLKPSPTGSSNVTAKVAGTMVGSVLGTPLYMSPEQAIGQVTTIDHRTDVYSAGVVLYEMLCGRTPYLGESYVQIFASLLEGDYPAPRTLSPEIPPDVEAAIVCALDRDMSKRFPSAAAMRQALTGATGSMPEPVLLSASLGEPLRPADGLGPPVLGASSIALAAEPPGRAARKAVGRELVGTDPFAPPLEAEATPMLACDLDRPLALSVRPAVREDEPLPGKAKATKPAPSKKPPRAPERLLPSRARKRLLLVATVLALAIAARVAYSVFRPDGNGTLSLRHGEGRKVVLDVLPAGATVQLDHRPTTQRELLLDEGSEHVLNLTAPGRLTRRFSFIAKPGLKLTVKLGHILPLPLPTDPPPLPAELSADCPERPRAAEEIDSAFAKLDKLGECLALGADAGGDGRRAAAHTRMRAEELGLCQRLVGEAAEMSPPMPELQIAAEAYLGAVRGNQRMEQLARLSTTFRAEYLAARTTWQLEELALEQQTGGDSANPHMRRMALAGQAWLRAVKAGQGVDRAGARLQESQRALVEQAQKVGPAGMAASGQPDFLRAADELVAQATVSRKTAEMVALDSSRRLISAFNGLILH